MAPTSIVSELWITTGDMSVDRFRLVLGYNVHSIGIGWIASWVFLHDGGSNVISGGNNYRTSGNRTITINGPACYVNKDDSTCGGKSPCYTSIQSAIDAADTGYDIRGLPKEPTLSHLILLHRNH